MSLSAAAFLARNVRAERARRGWRQVDLAARLDGWTADTVSDLETGRRAPLLDDLPRLCRVFNIGLAKLLDGADPADVQALRLLD